MLYFASTITEHGLREKMRQVYLDYSATTPVDKRVLDQMAPYFRENFGNASSIHKYGRDAKEAIERARERIAQVIRCTPEELYFTSGGTEADNWALLGYALAHKDLGNHIITTNIEHHAVLHTAKFLEQNGFDVTYLPVNNEGILDIDSLKNAITDKTILVSVMHINNEIGTINSLEEIGAVVKETDSVFHTDAVQSFGKEPIDVNSMNIDLLSISSHKIYGPKGIGALYIRKGLKISKMIYGGSNERNMRPGTENVSAIVGFGAAAKICKKELAKEKETLTGLRNYFWGRLEKTIPDVRLNGHPEKRLPGNLNVSFKDADGESILLSLDLRGIAASSGAACAAGGIEVSPVLKALGLPPEYGDSAIRFTLGRYTSKNDIDYTVEVLKEIVERIRNL
jgi:cysteine desulfurase